MEARSFPSLQLRSKDVTPSDVNRMKEVLRQTIDDVIMDL